MKNDRYRNRKYIFQILDRETFNWYDVFTAKDEEDMVEQLKPFCAYSEEYDQYRILKNTNGNEIVSEFLHGTKEIELFLERMTKVIEQKGKKGSHLMECLETSLRYIYFEDSNLTPHNKKSQIRSLD